MNSMSSLQQDEAQDSVGDVPKGTARQRRGTLTRKMTVEEEHSGDYFK